MDRRALLEKIVVAGGVAFVAPAVVSRAAHADGGSVTSLRPTPSSVGGLTASITGSGKAWISITTSTANFSPVTCPSGTSTAQLRWQLTSSPAGHALYTTSGGATLEPSAFSAETAGVTSVTNPVFVRPTGGGNLTAGIYVVRLTGRFICTVGGVKYWSCRAFTISVDWDNGGGANGTINSQTPATVGPPDNSASCDTPAP